MRKFIAAAATAAIVATAVVSFVATPAFAAEDLEAARNICERDGHGYNFLDSGGLNPDGDRSARVYLFYSPGNGKNCVVSRKYNLYNLATPLRAGIQVGGDWKVDADQYFVYAGPVRYDGRGKCVRYKGYYFNGQNESFFQSPWGWCG